MGKKKNAKKNGVLNDVLNIDANSVKVLFEKLTPKGVVLKSTTAQMKDLGVNDFHYTMRGVDALGKPCVLVLNTQRDKVSSKENPVMKSVDPKVVAKINAEFATKQILSLCGNNIITTGDARPIEIAMRADGMHYGYAICATQGQQQGYVTLEPGAESIKFTENTPKFLYD